MISSNDVLTQELPTDTNAEKEIDELLKIISDEIEEFRKMYEFSASSVTYNDWYVIGFKEEYYDMLTSMSDDLGEDIVRWLNKHKCPLDFLYNEWISCDSSFSHNWDKMMDWISCIYSEQQELLSE